MTTKILGYMSAPTTPQKRPTIKQKIKPIRIHNLKEKALGAILIAIGAITIPLENDATAFAMCLMLGIAAIIGGDKNV